MAFPSLVRLLEAVYDDEDYADGEKGEYEGEEEVSEVCKSLEGIQEPHSRVDPCL